MKGDIILVEEHHYNAADKIIPHLIPVIQKHQGCYTISVAGESGSGKSETGTALAERLERDGGFNCLLLQQDDYFVYPPKSNDAARRRDISWVGTQEVKLDLLNEHLLTAINGGNSITKPLVVYEEDRIEQETIDLKNVQVVIAEGTYTSLLKDVHTRIFIARNRLETMASRQKRAREAMDPFIEQVLEIEHSIIAPHRQLANIIITRDYEVEFT
ncbi:uridine kinase family protein [Spirochaeta dissipatitropha]